MKIFKYLAIASAAALTVACGTPAAEGSKEVQALLPSKAQVDSASYLLGISFGSQLKGQNFGEMNYDELVKGMKDFMHAEGTPQDSTFAKQFRINPDEHFQRVLNDFLQKRQAYSAALNTEKGDAFIEVFMKEDGAQKSESGLAFRIEEAGNDNHTLADRDSVWVNYKGSLIDGTVFDEREDVLFVMYPGSLVDGFREGLEMIGEGGKIHLVIPGKLGYGERGARGIEPNSTLVFDLTKIRVSPYVEPVVEPEKPAKKK